MIGLQTHHSLPVSKETKRNEDVIPAVDIKGKLSSTTAYLSPKRQKGMRMLPAVDIKGKLSSVFTSCILAVFGTRCKALIDSKQ